MAKGQRKHEKRRLADMTVQPPPSGWEPYREGHPQVTTVDVFGARIEHRMWWDGRLLTDFILNLQVNSGDEGEPAWEDIFRVDCCHREVHAHRLYVPDPDEVYKVIREVASPDDLWEGADLAETMVYGDWEKHLRRWDGGG